MLNYYKKCANCIDSLALDALNIIVCSSSHILSGSQALSLSLVRGPLPKQKGRYMNQNATDDMRTEYDFSDAVQGKHHKAYQEGTNVILLEPDIARVFRDSASVNRALRLLIEIAHNQTPKHA